MGVRLGQDVGHKARAWGSRHDDHLAKHERFECLGKMRHEDLEKHGGPSAWWCWWSGWWAW